MLAFHSFVNLTLLAVCLTSYICLHGFMPTVNAYDFSGWIISPLRAQTQLTF